MKKIILFVIFALIITGCSEEPMEITPEMTLQYIAERDIETLAGCFEESGVRLSAYLYVTDKDLVFTADEFTSAYESENRHVFGYFDGTGDPIEMTLSEYYERFIYDVDFTAVSKNAMPDENTIYSHGNTINNISEYYEDCVFYEYYLEGTNPDYGGMDWRSLTLVFKETENGLKLVGIIHGEWTI